MALFRSILQAWHRMSPVMRIMAIALPFSAAIVIGVLIAVTLPREATLFATPLESEQLSQVDAQLAAWNIAHVTTPDNIEIDSALRNTVLLRLSLAGLPHAHIATSDETLAKASALTPDALLEAQSRTGLAGDVAVALRSIDGVADASVVIAPAREATFSDDASSAASASVRLSLRPGFVLSKDAIDGIRSFVSSAVPFLARERVVLLDDHGVALGSRDTSRDEAESTRSALQSAFDSAFGDGATIVRVHANYEQRAEAVHDTERLPVGGAPIALQHSDEHFQGSNKQYAKRDATEEHGSIVRDRQSSLAAGTLQRLSVAIFVDQSRGIDLEKIRSLAIAATGIDANDSDNVRVEAVNFARLDGHKVTPLSPWFNLALMSLPYLLGGFVFAVLIRSSRRPLRLLIRKLSHRRVIRSATEASAGIAPSDVAGILAGEPPHTAAAVISALPTVTAAAVLDLYPHEERAAIIARMTRQASVFAPTWEQLTRGR